MKKPHLLYTSLLAILLSACEIVLPSLPSTSGEETLTSDPTSVVTTSEDPSSDSSLTSSDSSSVSSSETPSSSSSLSSSDSSSLSSSSESSLPPQPVGYSKQTAPTITYDQYRSRLNQVGYPVGGLPTTGEVKLLVIPVTFSDFRCNTVCTTRREQIEASFFGAKEQTAWHSVKSYYETSSYGSLSFNGVVTPWYDSPWSTSEFASLTTNQGDYADAYDPTWSMLDNAITWYKNLTGSNLTEYDTNQDGYVDAVYMIYNNPNSSNPNSYTAAGDDVYWAYVYWQYNNIQLANVNNPVGMTLGWSSYDFMFEGYGTSQLDAHTYIHETGHLFGLDDYYTYSEDDWGALGGLDMMDYNILDHNAFSKYKLGWTKPYLLDEGVNQATITLNPFESSGDFLLIGNQWNGSAFDNYLAIEFYTPTGINQKDSAAAYPGNSALGFTVPGVKIHHVDARLGRYSNSSGSFLGYVNTVNVASNSYPMIAHSNSVDYSQNENYKLIHLLQAGGTNTFITGSTASNATLFRQGSTFNPATTHGSFFTEGANKLNNGLAIGYRIEIQSMTSNQATLVVTKL
jgi:M6 family metalloprotease-like protein